MENNEVQELVLSICEKLGMTPDCDAIVKRYRTPTPETEEVEAKEDLPKRARRRYFAWRDVLGRMLAHPGDVKVSQTRCPHCRTPLVTLDFVSPPWTWRDLCGREGPMVICPNCPKQYSFILTIMN